LGYLLTLGPVKRGDLIDIDSIMIIKMLLSGRYLVSIIREDNDKLTFSKLNHNILDISELPPLYEVERGLGG
jgi:hypothetical protein